jgi:3-hydroxyacyl-[acyl-carrier-protein] dehydratase
MSANPSVLLNIKDILKILPHRYPFLLVDRILHLDLETSTIIGQKNMTMNEQFFQGHFPGVPVMPGVLILEALAQTGGILVFKKGFDKKIAVLLNINNAKFRRPIVPGDIVTLHAVGPHLTSKGGKVETKAMVGDKIVAQAEIGFALVDKEQL